MILAIIPLAQNHGVRVLRHAHENANRHSVQVELLLQTRTEEAEVRLVDFLRVAEQHKAGRPRLRLREVLQFHLLSRARARRRVPERHGVQPPVQDTCRHARPPSIEHGQRQREHRVRPGPVEGGDHDRRHVACLGLTALPQPHHRDVPIHVGDELLLRCRGRLHHVTLVQHHEQSASIVQNLP